MEDLISYFYSMESKMLNGCELKTTMIEDNKDITLYFKVNKNVEIIYVNQYTDSTLLVLDVEAGAEYVTTKEGLGVWLHEITRNMYNRNYLKVIDKLYRLDWRG
ncbi:hypothetical protein TwortDSMZ_147 [Staphylococcus phage Twort]|uniref:ORF110 n=2 Tax=Staphylococcus phage Twort (strain DSM 17442 / HER 48) TaxID=2908167 RepID=Q4Z998_BPTWO|nr:ORF110 [Staphylococcus phage Twort]AAX92402.1 ORF110 [Staphylococcus phage Twort]QIW89146.1 hypothetical protein TwortDSMZ_147 [Staphylococcus phage Twort]